jgi:hypothetical protein
MVFRRGSSAPYAEAITRRERYKVGKSNLLGETGMHVTKLAPTDYEHAELLRRLFFRLWPPPFVDGVVVLAVDLPFEQQTEDAYLLPAASDSLIDLSGFVVGHGERMGDRWEFDASLVV